MLLATAGSAVAATQRIRIIVNGIEHHGDVYPVIINSRTMVPLRLIAESLGAQVGWDQATKTVTVNTTDPSAPKQWTKVTELSGSTDKRGELFTLTGGQARLTYSVNGDTMPVCSIYVMKAGTSLESDGGFPEVSVMENKSDSTMLVKSAGQYYLDVKAASANWTVTIEEYK